MADNQISPDCLFSNPHPTLKSLKELVPTHHQHSRPSRFTHSNCGDLEIVIVTSATRPPSLALKHTINPPLPPLYKSSSSSPSLALTRTICLHAPALGPCCISYEEETACMSYEKETACPSTRPLMEPLYVPFQKLLQLLVVVKGAREWMTRGQADHEASARI